MKRIAENDLARVALSKGATIEYEGNTLNASGRRLAVVSARPAPVIDKPALPEPPAVDVNGALADLVSVNQQSLERLAAMQVQFGAVVAETMAAALKSALPPQQAPVKEWVFTVEYDDSYPVKRMARIRATAIR